MDAGAEPGREELEEVLLGAPCELDRDEVAEVVGIDEATALAIWNAMGFAEVPPGEKAFTSLDVAALRTALSLRDSGLVDQDTLLVLARSMGQALSRTADAQVDVFRDMSAGMSVEEATVAAAGAAAEVLPKLEQLVVHVWRRQFAASVARAFVAATEDGMPLLSVGFVDLVDFTRSTQQWDASTLERLLERFESETSLRVTAVGGQVVKTLGDAVMYATDDPGTAVEVALQTLEAHAADDELPRRARRRRARAGARAPRRRVRAAGQHREPPHRRGPPADAARRHPHRRGAGRRRGVRDQAPAPAVGPRLPLAHPLPPAPHGRGRPEGLLMTLLDLEVQTLSGETTTLGALTGGRAALVVNVASRCGLTPQYTALEQLHETRDDLVVIGVPCNQFMGQEPGTAEEIQEFCSATYGVTFPMLAKTDVNGADRAPLFEALAQVPDADGETGDVQWNFEKWLVSPAGEPVARFRPGVVPEDPAIAQAVDEVTAAR